MRKGIYILPNSLTLCGMFCGFYAILTSFKGQYVHAAWAIMVANIFDGLDGWVARLTNTTTRFGIELDSLSDLVAFGVAPAVLVYSWGIQPFGRLAWGAAFLYAMSGALRLARYNVQMGSAESKAFTGLPIPAAGSAIATLVLFYTEVWGVQPDKNFLILFLPVLLAVLMVTTFRFHSLKEIDFKKRKPFGILVMIMAALILIFMHPEIVLFSFAIIYICWGIIEGTYTFQKNMKIKRAVK